MSGCCWAVRSGSLRRAAAAGITVTRRGGPWFQSGAGATVIADVTPDMLLYRDEIFGPACTLIPFDSNDEAVQLATDGPYGLTAGVIGEDLTQALAVARRLDTGIVHVSDQTIGDEPQAPFGGVGDSGYGRFGGQAGINEFTTTRWITIQAEHRAFPMWTKVAGATSVYSSKAGSPKTS